MACTPPSPKRTQSPKETQSHTTSSHKGSDKAEGSASIWQPEGRLLTYEVATCCLLGTLVTAAFLALCVVALQRERHAVTTQALTALLAPFGALVRWWLARLNGVPTSARQPRLLDSVLATNSADVSASLCEFATSPKLHLPLSKFHAHCIGSNHSSRGRESVQSCAGGICAGFRWGHFWPTCLPAASEARFSQQCSCVGVMAQNKRSSTAS